MKKTVPWQRKGSRKLRNGKFRNCRKLLKLARKVFKAYENEMYIRRCNLLINSLSALKSNHNIAESLIQKREIDDSRCEKDLEYELD